MLPWCLPPRQPVILVVPPTFPMVLLMVDRSNGIIFWTKGRYKASAAVPFLFGTNGLTNVRICRNIMYSKSTVTMLHLMCGKVLNTFNDIPQKCIQFFPLRWDRLLFHCHCSGGLFNFLSSCSYFAFKTTKIVWLLLHSNMKVMISCVS